MAAPANLADSKAHLASCNTGYGANVAGLRHGNRPPEIAPGRHIVDIPGYSWDFNVENCTADKRIWIADGEILICTGCGLDCT